MEGILKINFICYKFWKRRDNGIPSTAGRNHLGVQLYVASRVRAFAPQMEFAHR